MHVGERIKARRTELGMPAVDLAEAVKVRAHTIWRYEAGRCAPSIDVLTRLARALHVTTDWLLSGDEPVSPKAAS